MQFLTRLTLAGVIAFVSVGCLHAQGRAVELGVDAGLSVLSAEGTTLTSIDIPTSAFRAGFFVSDKVSIEPTVGIRYQKVDDFSLTMYGLGVGLLYHLTTDRDRPQVFLRPLVGYSGASSDGESNGSAVVGFGAGAKVPKGERLAIRFGADYQRRFQDGDTPALNGFGATIGISFFTR